MSVVDEYQDSYNRAVDLLESGQYEEAAEYAKQAVQLDKEITRLTGLDSWSAYSEAEELLTLIEAERQRRPCG